MVTWRRGRRVLRERLYGHGLAVENFLDRLDPQLIRVPGTAVFLTGNAAVVPMALLHNIKHNKVLHERNVLLTVETLPVPSVDATERLRIDTIGDDLHRATVRYGFMETPDVPLALMRAGDDGVAVGVEFRGVEMAMRVDPHACHDACATLRLPS